MAAPAAGQVGLRRRTRAVAARRLRRARGLRVAGHGQEAGEDLGQTEGRTGVSDGTRYDNEGSLVGHGRYSSKTSHH